MLARGELPGGWRDPSPALRYRRMPTAVRRWNGWGATGERFEAPTPACEWLKTHVGAGAPLGAVDEHDVRLPPPRPITARMGSADTGEATRLRFACGRSFPDLVALRTGRIAAFPDAVCFPESAEQVAAVLRLAAAEGMTVIPHGGGTSVVGGVTVESGSRPVVVLALERLRGLAGLDSVSLLATFRAGTLGPEVEAALATHGLRLGHEPQSFEFSSVGGWIATRSAGHRSTGIGKIEELVAGLEVATPHGLWRLPPQPASAAGPELRRFVIGSEGRLGVVTEATLRVRRRPEAEDGMAALLPSWSAGVEVCRELLQRGLPPEVLRLSDPSETSFANALTELAALQERIRRVLFGLRRFRHGCFLLLGWAGDSQEVILAPQVAARLVREAGGVPLGRSGWRRWLAERFRHPYLRDELLSHGWGLDTIETATSWSRLDDVRAAVNLALDRAAGAEGFRVAELCHLSHAYRDGASLYFTVFWPLRPGRELADWGALKHAATTALLAAGGTVSHHHGVGRMHAPFLAAEIGATGVATLGNLARTLDPGGTLNPGVLLCNERGDSGGGG
jgi:alkyldihydroxyacetonephosphate synthase